VSIGVLKLGVTQLMFVDSGILIGGGSYYLNVRLS
jgi:hypothetical protein